MIFMDLYHYTLKQPKKFWNLGAFICALIAIAIHGMIGFDMKTIVEAIATLWLMIKQKTHGEIY